MPSPCRMRRGLRNFPMGYHPTGFHTGTSSGMDRSCALLEQIPVAAQNGDYLLAIAVAEIYLGEWKAARSHLEHAHQLLSDGTREKVQVWHQLGTIDLNEGQDLAAQENFEKAMRLWRELGDRAGEAATLYQLAAIQLYNKNYVAAKQKFASALEIEQTLSFRVGEFATWYSIASIRLKERDYVGASEIFSMLLEVAQAFDDPAGEAATLHQLASIDLDERDYAGACRKFTRALQIDQRLGHRVGEADIFYQIASLAYEVGHRHIGVRLHAICYLIDRTIGHRDTERNFAIFTRLCSELGYDQQQSDAAPVRSRGGIPDGSGPESH